VPEDCTLNKLRWICGWKQVIFSGFSLLLIPSYTIFVACDDLASQPSQFPCYFFYHTALLTNLVSWGGLPSPDSFCAQDNRCNTSSSMAVYYVWYVFGRSHVRTSALEIVTSKGFIAYQCSSIQMLGSHCKTRREDLFVCFSIFGTHIHPIIWGQ
jgi:hypothetical protein